MAAAGVAQDELTYYQGGVGSGVWKTTDAGLTWTNIADETFGTSSVGAIAVAPSDPNVVWVGMGEHAVRGVMTSHGDGVYRSTDGGETWTHLGLERTRHIARIEVHPTNPDVAWVAAQGAAYGASEDRGIYRTNDGGRTWEKVLFVSPTASAAELAMDPTNPRILYAGFWDHQRFPWYVRSGGEGSGLWKTTDGGDTWQQINNGLPGLMGKTAVDVSPSNPKRLYAMIEAAPDEGGLYRSDDAGASWQRMTGDWALRARPWYYTEVYADPVDDNTVYVLSAPMLKSIDGGRTFANVRTPHGDQHDLWINPNNARVMINANDGGANVSFNGGQTWSTQGNQPTVQFYRVAVDHQYPYRVYGGQQDNSSLSVASAAAGGIGMEDTYPVGGCESAFTGFDPDNPRFIYAGCYMGLVTEYDHQIGAARDIKVYPTMPAALRADEMKYRFNWSAPIFVSRHNPQVIYHAGNHLLRSRDGGRSWQEASPDLTAADPEKLGRGGGPITNEGAGGEIYATITYAAESPLQQGLLWTGSDDGRVHVSRDDGATWTDVTPRGLPEAQINAIDPSPHDPARAYIAVTRYKVDDFTPMAYRTDDYGASWTPIVDGFAEEHWVRVVREDPTTPGLLYAGTEQGLYLSTSNGEQWMPFGLNLPRTPITDITVQGPRNDLVISTSGWGFWILDDLSPLQQFVAGESDSSTGAQRSADGGVTLFAPRVAIRDAAPGGRAGGDVGQNPPEGALIDIFIEQGPDASVALEVIDAQGRVVRRFAAEPDEDAGDALLRLRSGLNRINWDLRYAPVFRVPGLFVFGSTRGQRAIPGDYTVRLSWSDERLEVPLTIAPDPRIDVAKARYAEQDAFLASVRSEIEALHRSVVDLDDVRTQIEALVERLEAQTDDAEGPLGDALSEGHELVRAFTEVEDSLVQWETYDGQTVLNAPSRINFQYLILWGNAEGADSGITKGQQDLFNDLNARWWPLRERLQQLFDEGIRSFNEKIEEAGVPPIDAPKGPRLVS